MREQLPVLLAVAVVLLLGFLGYELLFAPSETVALEVLEAQGEVERVGADGVGTAAVVGEALEVRERLRVGEGGRAVLGVGEGSRLTLESRSTIQVTRVEAQSVRVELEEGRVQARVRPGGTLLGIARGGQSVEVEDGRVAVAAGEDGVLRVQAEEGRVRLGGFDEITELAAGERLSRGVGGEQIREPVPRELLLEVRWPKEQATREDEITVRGTAPPFARVQVRARGGSVVTRSDGRGAFSVVVALEEGENEVEVVVEDGFGGSTRSRHTVIRDTEAPQATSAEVVWGP